MKRLGRVFWPLVSTAAIVFNGDVFKNFSNSIKPTNSNLPGAWTDRLSY